MYAVSVARPENDSLIGAGYDPAWSALGQLAFSAALPAAPPQETSCGPRTQAEIFVINRAGAWARVTRTETNEYNVAWSPDGLRIAFVADGVIAVANRDGRGRRQLTTHSTDAGMYTLDGNPSWSPDGSRMVFGRLVIAAPSFIPSPVLPPLPAPSVYELVTINADGSGEQALTKTPDASELQPAWSPDERQIAFTEYASGGPFVAVMDAEGGSPRIIARGSQPAWSANGGSIAYVASTRKGDRIFVMRADGSHKRQLTH